VNAVLKSGYENMGQFKQNFNGGPCVTKKFRYWLFTKHETLQELTSICAPKLRSWYNWRTCMAAFFPKWCIGKLYLVGWWCTTKKWTIKTETPFCIYVPVVL